MKIIDAHPLMVLPEPPMEWFLDRLIPMGMTMDLFSPPGVGKTTLLTDLALAVAAEDGKWHGRSCTGGPVVVLGGERTDAGALARDLHRTRRDAPPPGMLLFPQDDSGDCPPLWRWDKKIEDWHLTDWGCQVTEYLSGWQVALVILDTILSAAQGADLLDQPQQYLLGQRIRQWAKGLGLGACITSSHTNQASASAALADRMDYLSRAGGNGFPGALRHIAGMTKLRPGEVPGFDPMADETLFAIGFSKSNESPRPVWTNYKPALFTQGKSGKLALLADSQEVADRIASRGAEDDGGGKHNKRPNPDAYKAARSGERRSYASC